MLSIGTMTGKTVLRENRTYIPTKTESGFIGSQRDIDESKTEEPEQRDPSPTHWSECTIETERGNIRPQKSYHLNLLNFVIEIATALQILFVNQFDPKSDLLRTRLRN